jgi:DNA-binding PucR family transcriptional regulator
MHKNSVKYRVEKAEQERGRPIRGDHLDGELALHACHWLGHAVLNRPT